MTRISAAFSLLCVLCGVMSSSAFVFEDCGSELGQLQEIVISSCDTSAEKCSFTRGNDVLVSIKFTPNKDIPNLKAYAFGVLLDVPIPFPLEKPDVCKDPGSGLQCPLKKDQMAEYKATFNVEKKTPTVSVDVMWEFRTDNDEKIICIKFPIRVV